MTESVTVELFASAKINLSLDVVGQRQDGYHELRTVMHTIPLWDTLTVTHGGEGLHFSTSLSFISPESDISYRSALAFYRRLGVEPGGLTVHTQKRIPVGAGLGGGSADGAALLTHLNAWHGRPLSDDELCAVAASVGADLPFLVRANLAAGDCSNGTEFRPYAALCEGIGEKITPAEPLHSASLVLVKPKVSLSTAAMFASIDSQKRKEHPDTEGMLQSLADRDLHAIGTRCFNSMERAAVSKCPQISEIAEFLRSFGALGACMSGSGSTVFGLFPLGGESAILSGVREHFPKAECFALSLR